MKKSLLFIILGVLILWSCQRNRMDVDISAVKTEPLRVLRLEKDLFSLTEDNFGNKTSEIKSKYGIYYEHYLMNFLSRRGTNDSNYKKATLNFIGDKDVREAYNYVKEIFPEPTSEVLFSGVNDCVKRFKYHFPDKKLPNRLITCVTGWNYAFAYMDSALVVSLDMYLGDTAKFYQMLRYPQYQTRKMNEINILPDIARGWLLTEFDNTAAENNLLSHTIFYGKLFYAVNALLPNISDSLIIGYSSKQMAFCNKFEKKLWSYFAEKNRLYENNLATIRELTNDGPFTGTIHKDCPPRIAMWVGWQIVKSYMEKNEAVTLAGLMNEKDAQKILTKSKYRP